MVKKVVKIRIKRAAVCIVIIGLMCCFTACSLKSDAGERVQAYLDMTAKKEYHTYAKLSKKSESEVKNERESLLRREVNRFLSDTTVSDQTRQNISMMFDMLYSKWNYEVGEASENEDGSFVVPVTIRQLKAFTGVQEVVKERIHARTDSVKEGTEQYQELYYQTLAETVMVNANAGEYTSASTVRVNISPEETDDFMDTLTEKMMDLSQYTAFYPDDEKW